MTGRMLIKNARVVTPSGTIENGYLLTENGMIKAIDTIIKEEPEITLDAGGKYLLPGFVDLHCDCIEKEIEQRTGRYFPANISIIEMDKKAVASGITTTFYSLSFAGAEIGLRSNTMAREIVKEIIRLKSRLMADSRIHARFEVTASEALPLISDLIKAGKVDMVSLMDHTPGQGQFRTENDYKNYYGKTYKKDESTMKQDIREKRERQIKDVPGNIESIVELCKKENITMASHDDDTDAKIRFLKEHGIFLTEFPVNIETARIAKENGINVVLGAPNILKGGSHTNNLSALDALKRGYASIICSDYMATSMLYAVFKLVEFKILDLTSAVNMVSLNPAKAVNFLGHKGSLEPGKDADMVLVDDSFEVPVIERVFVKGMEVYHRRLL